MLNDIIRWYYTSLSVIMFLTGQFPSLLNTMSAYGKLRSTSTSTNIITRVSNWSVHKSYFSVFYVVATCWNSALLWSMWQRLVHARNGWLFTLLADYDTPNTTDLTATDVVWLATLMQVHVMKRLYEHLFIIKRGKQATLPVHILVLSIVYYVGACVGVWIDGAPALGIWGSVVPGHIGWRHALGTVAFAVSSITQTACHIQLANLRKGPGDAGRYVRPNGGLFDYVACPHYLAEIGIYTSYAFLSNWSLTTCSIVLLVVGNLSFSARDTLQWYRRKFEDYPPSRRALIPFLF
jgi:hypothetical protein